MAARKAELHGEGISSEATFGTSDEVATAATEFEAAHGNLDVPRRPPEGADASARRRNGRRDMTAVADRSHPLVPRGIRKEFGGLVAVSDIDFDIPRGTASSA